MLPPNNSTVPLPTSTSVSADGSDKAQPWWKHAVVYQIYPISFFDSNGDGIGDLQGIRAKLDYLKDLGVDVIWLCPIYKSPLADMGYDISDYRDIDPRYGTLQDWDELLKAAHERGMKLVMDLVVNHSSDEHEWFLQSRSTKDNPKRDWYIWRPAKYEADGVTRREPNNWRAVFQGSAWDYDAKTDEYYLHLYLPKQPDLNWDNPQVREAVWDLMRFWLDRGCDGFRMDVINLISKVEGLPDAPVTVPGEKYQLGSELFANGPRAHEYIREMNTKVLSKYDIMTVGETPFTHDQSKLAEYALPGNKELDMVFQFELMDIDSPPELPLQCKAWKLSELKGIIGKWQKFKRDEGFWNTVFIENHDHARAVARFGDDSTDEARALTAKLLTLLEICQGGTLYIYQGQELGLKNFPRTWGIEEYKDVATLNYWNKIKKQRQEEQGKEDVDMSDVLDGCARKARDHARVPMQWNSSPHAGFTTGQPWMRVNDDYKEWNVEHQVNDERSVYAFYKRALVTRKQYKVLIYGDFEDISKGDEKVFAFVRRHGSATALVILNFHDGEVEFSLDTRGYQFVLGNYHDDGGDGQSVKLRRYEGRLYINN